LRGEIKRKQEEMMREAGRLKKNEESSRKRKST
jgi:hypothetical protein